MKKEEIVENLSKSKDWEYDDYEGWWIATYKCCQYDESMMLRIWDVGITYEEDSDKFQVFNANCGKIIVEFYGEDIKQFACTKTTLFVGSKWELYLN